MRNNRLLLALAVSGALAFGAAACGDDDEGSGGSSNAASDGGGEVSGKITIDGSSTVGPFAEAAAELFNEENPDVQVTVGISGTGGGFEKFCAGETDISDASRPIKDDEEVPLCEKAGVKYTEVQIANDGIAVASSKELAVDCLTTDQLKKVWNKGSAPTPARSTSSPTRSTARRASAARTTRPPRTTTSSSPASPATRAGSATSASPTTRARPTSST
jgi:ABC-type phosphate transport system substrate-binding protein